MLPVRVKMSLEEKKRNQDIFYESMIRRRENEQASDSQQSGKLAKKVLNIVDVLDHFGAKNRIKPCIPEGYGAGWPNYLEVYLWKTFAVMFDETFRYVYTMDLVPVGVEEVSQRPVATSKVEQLNRLRGTELPERGTSQAFLLWVVRVFPFSTRGFDGFLTRLIVCGCVLTTGNHKTEDTAPGT